jgi:multidrug efflux pump subunit AcrA (membrane-fusion protein)
MPVLIVNRWLVSLPVKVGDEAKSGQGPARIDPRDFEVKVETISVPESLISYAPYVERTTVTFDAFPGFEVPAMIKEIGREASQATRTYPVPLIMGQP